MHVKKIKKVFLPQFCKKYLVAQSSSYYIFLIGEQKTPFFGESLPKEEKLLFQLQNIISVKEKEIFPEKEKKMGRSNKVKGGSFLFPEISYLAPFRHVFKSA
jgi:hypothetical protein